MDLDSVYGSRKLLNPDPDPGSSWIRIQNEVKHVRFKILINNLEPRLVKNFVGWQFVLIVIYFFHRNLFFSKIILNFFFQNWLWYNPGSGSKFNVFCSKTLVKYVQLYMFSLCSYIYVLNLKNYSLPPKHNLTT